MGISVAPPKQPRKTRVKSLEFTLTKGNNMAKSDKSAPDITEMDDDAVNDFLRQKSSSWATDGNGTYWLAGKNTRKIVPGLYRAGYSDRTGPLLTNQLVSTDNLIYLPDSTSSSIIEEIKEFWRVKAKFDERGLLHKRGILMSGDPGCGKTSTIQILIKQMIEMGGVAIYPDQPKITAQCLQMFRQIQPEVPILLVMEDFETLVMRPEYENEWLSILDGESQVDNIVFLATTNYISKLDKRFVDRPSRFDKIIFVKMPNADARRLYLSTKEKSLTPAELDKWVEETKGFGIAHLKEIIVSVKVFGNSFEDTIARMKKMRERDFSEDENLEGTPQQKPTFGFGLN